jgi:hypothetical protein
MLAPVTTSVADLLPAFPSITTRDRKTTRNDAEMGETWIVERWKSEIEQSAGR